MAAPRTAVFRRSAPAPERRISYLGDLPRYSTLALAGKRLMDVAGSLVGLVFCVAAYLLLSRRIRRESGGSVLFRQRRVGKSGREFEMHKFRTMAVDAEHQQKKLLARNEMRGPVFKIRDDPRIIPVGKLLRRFHIDELPQFWDVFRGKMSLVGARPPTPSEVELYEPHHFRRLRMKPGLTGLWQLYGNSHVNDFEEIVSLDCRYIDNWSLWLDLKILLKTLPRIAKGNGW
jgi:lipopolysaccharide/colanic/teichoic acid biosynthesis glycosyltransferase